MPQMLKSEGTVSALNACGAGQASDGVGGDNAKST
jgi:hypothetical protein